MLIDPNPYQSPQVAPEQATSHRSPGSNVASSIFMICAGAFFCVTSLYAVFGHVIPAAIAAYENVRFSFAFMVFYGVAGGFTSAFHLSHLIGKWPTQAMAGMYAISIGGTVAAIAVLIMELAT